MPSDLILSVSTILRPFKQGDLSHLCGLYAVINAASLVLYPNVQFSRSRARDLSERGLDFLHRRHKLHEIVTSGMTPALQRTLAFHLIKHINADFGVNLRLERIELTQKTYAETLMKMIYGGHPVCLCLEGTLNHFTILCGVSTSRYRVFDSQRLTYVYKASCELDGPNAGHKRHQINPKSAFTMILEE